MPNPWIVTPTYQERRNIETHVTAIRRVVPTATVLIVDDASPDGTGQVADQIAAGDSQVKVLHRPAKAGLGTAYMDGLRVALDGGATELVHLDADGSHPPEQIPDLLSALIDHDLALGSRYVPGGSMKIDPWRQLISNTGNAYIRALLGRAIHDWSTGFKAWRRDLLEKVMRDRPRATGYAWLMETSWLAVQHGARVQELPLVFRPRQAGSSKFSAAIAAEDLAIAWRLRWRRTLVEGRKP